MLLKILHFRKYKKTGFVSKKKFKKFTLFTLMPFALFFYFSLFLLDYFKIKLFSEPFLMVIVLSLLLILIAKVGWLLEENTVGRLKSVDPEFELSTLSSFGLVISFFNPLFYIVHVICMCFLPENSCKGRASGFLKIGLLFNLGIFVLILGLASGIRSQKTHLVKKANQFSYVLAGPLAYFVSGILVDLSIMSNQSKALEDRGRYEKEIQKYIVKSQVVCRLPVLQKIVTTKPISQFIKKDIEYGESPELKKMFGYMLNSLKSCNDVKKYDLKEFNPIWALSPYNAFESLGSLLVVSILDFNMVKFIEKKIYQIGKRSRDVIEGKN